jgi:hypothetical protein
MYSISSGTIPPASTGIIRIQHNRSKESDFWVNHSWSFQSIRGFP